uniref:Protein kintoun n=1 Tax=Leptobrachium leishanense TaxID=445787 RepID=A0A8C5QI11_9ANUR
MAAKLDRPSGSPPESASFPTEEELERFKQAFHDEEFRKMFAEYLEELNDPDCRRRYEEEIRQLERDRGMDVRFVYPSPGYVLLTSANRLRRCYINVCSNGIVPKPRGVRGTDDNAHEGLYWTLPYTVTPTRETVEPDSSKSLLYDVVFHPDTLELAGKNSRFKQMVDSLAMGGVAKHFNLELDAVNVRTLDVSYVGPIQSAVLRKPIPGFVPDPEKVSSPLSFPYPYNAPTGTGADRPQPKLAKSKPKSSYVPPTTPRYTIRHRSYIDFQDYTLSRYSAPSLVPDELVITVDLPLLESASDANLDILSKELHLESKDPTYKLHLTLPYAVNENGSKAQFNKAKRQLVISVPVIRRSTQKQVGCYQGIPVCSSPLPETTTSPRNCQQSYTKGQDVLLSPDVLRPQFTCTQDNTSLAVVLQTPDIDGKSVQATVEINRFCIAYRVKRSCACYFLLIQFLPKYSLNRNELSVNVSQNNAVVELTKSSETFGLWKNFYFGDNRQPLQERKFVCDDNVAEFLESSSQVPQVPWSTLEDDLLLEVLELNDQQTHIQLNKSDDSLSKEAAADPPETGCVTSVDSDPLTSAEVAPAETEDPQMSPQPEVGREESQSISEQSEPLVGISRSGRSASAGELGNDSSDAGHTANITAQQEVSQPIGPEQSADPEPILKVNVEDGHLEVPADHSTQCAFTFQNQLLFDLD